MPFYFTCQHCGVVFSAPPSQRRRFCSRVCMAFGRTYQGRVSPTALYQRHVIPTIDGCWRWSGYQHRGGYGGFKASGVFYLAHRFSYLLHVGPIPSGMLVCHRCDNPICTRPDHLFLGTQADNLRDMYAKGRSRWQR